MQILRGRGGIGYRPMWYAVYRDGAKSKKVNLGVPIRGTPPTSLSVLDKGDAAFEKSRGLAEAKLSEFIEEGKTKGNAEHLVRRLIAMKTGEGFMDVRLDSLADMECRRLSGIWRDDETTRNHVAYLKHRKVVFGRLASWAMARGISCVHEITTKAIGEYFADLKGCYSRESVGKHLGIIAAAWRRYAPQGLRTPFGDVPDLLRGLSKESPPVPHNPLTKEQIMRLWECAAKHDRDNPAGVRLHPLAVLAACTGMRIGDCCRLKWESVDLCAKPHPLITVATAKTRATVTLPIFSELLPVLEAALSEREDGEAFVFPDARARYEADTSGITNMGKRLFARALFSTDKAEAVGSDVKPGDMVRAVRASKWREAKRAKVEEIVIRHFVKMESYRTIAEALGLSRGQISGYLCEVEALVGSRVRKGGGTCGGSMAQLVGMTRQARAGAGNAACLYGWHSLRASFVVLALARGIPRELVRKIVGHATLEMTGRYFNPTEKNAADLFARYTGGSLFGNGPKTALEARRAKDDKTHGRKAADAGKGGIRAFLASLGEDERREIRKLLLASPGE